MLKKMLYIIALLDLSRGLQLKQVTVLSRHNIRTPLSSSLESLTPKDWPVWRGNTGDLTPKGGTLERAMGRYFSNWMIEKKLLKNNCPQDEVFVFSNTGHRAVETAKSFVDGAFAECVGLNVTTMAPVFSLAPSNYSGHYKEVVVNEMRRKLNDIQLTAEFKELNRIVDFNNSLVCKEQMICDLSEMKNDIVFNLNKVPDVLGSLNIGFMLVDAFLMAYYDGMASENVGWGQIHSTEHWERLLKIEIKYLDIRFHTKPSDTYGASAMLEYLADVFQNGTKKFYLLVGHDANILSLMSSLNFKDYNLPGQFEKTPIGGKVVFQKWYDAEKDQDLLRVQYVYQSSEQLREGAEASLDNPPEWAPLEMENCTVDKDGFCPWNDFIDILKEAL